MDNFGLNSSDKFSLGLDNNLVFFLKSGPKKEETNSDSSLDSQGSGGLKMYNKSKYQGCKYPQG